MFRKKINLLSISLDKNILKQRFSDAQRRQLEYAGYFKNYTVIVLTSKKEGFKTKKIKNLKIIPTNSSVKLFSIFDAIKIALRENKKTPFDLITVQDPIATGLIGVILKFILKKPLNIQLHSEFIFSKNWIRERWIHRFWVPLISWQLNQADSIRVDNRAKLAKLRQQLPNLKAKIFQAPMRVNLDFFWKKPRKKKKIKKLISVGRLVKEKNFPLLIRAMKTVIKKYPNTTLTIIGGGPERLAIEKEIERGALSKNIRLTGPLSREKVRNHLWKSDLFVLSSNYEGWGLVFVEALASGLPIVATKVSSAGELVKNNKNGFIVPVSDEKGLTRGIISLIENPEKAYKFAKNGQAEIYKKFKPQKLVRLWIKGLYETAKIKP